MGLGKPGMLRSGPPSSEDRHTGKGAQLKRELIIAIAAAALLAAGISGCSADKKSSSSDSGTSTTTSAAAASADSGKVSIDGKPESISSSTECATAGGNVNIAIGGDAPDVAIVLTDANPPVVKSVGLGTIDGVAWAYTEGGSGNASATKNGNSYKITGTATGIDSANPTQPVNNPFEINVTCSS
jgi:lipoprotein LpqH